jgi:hypothetical protein
MKGSMNPAEPLPNDRHEAFAVHYAANGNAAQAWLHAGGKDGSHANANGSKWAGKGSIKARLGWLKAELARRIQAEIDAKNETALLTMEEKRKFLARVVRSKPADEPVDSDLWQEIEVKPDSVKRKMPDKLRAIAMDNDLAGEGAEAKAAGAIPEIAAALFDRIFPAA